MGHHLLSSREGEALAKWVCEMAEGLGCEVVVTDELESYKPAAEKAGLEHQLCPAHWRKATARRLKKITGYQQTHQRFRDRLGRKVPRTYQVPATNNACENAIGRGGKIRAKRMRGFKRADTMLPIMFLLASLGGVLAGVPFQSLIG